MSELTWPLLSRLHVDVLEESASYWATYIGQIAEASELIEGKVIGIINDEVFGGQLADDCRFQLRSIAGDLQDHIDEAANKIKVILEDAHEKLKPCKDEMNGLIDKAQAAKLGIKSDGTVHISQQRKAEIQTWAEQEAEKTGKPLDLHIKQRTAQVQTDECNVLTEDIQAVVEKARGYDDDFTARLNAIQQNPAEAALPPLGATWDEDWTERAIELLNGGGDGNMSAGELTEFTEILEAHGDNPEFATTLLKKLGPDGMMTNVADIVMDVYGNPPADTYSKEQIDRMYEAFGQTLASATNPNNQPHLGEEWTSELMQLGATEVTANTNGEWKAHGYSLLAPMLPHGKYHEDFIVPVTEHIMAIDKSGRYGLPTVTDLVVDESYGANPLNYALEAINHNPNAALNLFTDTGVGLEDIEGIEAERNGPVENELDYLMDRAAGEGPPHAKINPDLVGDAIESASTGVSTDSEYATGKPPAHSERMAGFANDVIKYVTNDPEKFTDESMNGMMDNFAGITTAYIDDFQHALASSSTKEWALDLPGASLPFDPGSDDSKVVNDWLEFLGNDQEATAEVWGASETLMYDQLRNVKDEGDYNEVFEMHGRLTGAMTVGTFEAISNGVHQDAEEQNRLVNAGTEGAKFLAGRYVGGATMNPWLGSAAGAATGYALDGVFGFAEMSEEEQQKKIDESTSLTAEELQDKVNSPGALGNISKILESNPNLDEDDRRRALENYYERYWDTVNSSYRESQDRD